MKKILGDQLQTSEVEVLDVSFEMAVDRGGGLRHYSCIAL